MVKIRKNKQARAIAELCDVITGQVYNAVHSGMAIEFAYLIIDELAACFDEHACNNWQVIANDFINYTIELIALCTGGIDDITPSPVQLVLI